jgi:hypothetical protein
VESLQPPRQLTLQGNGGYVAHFVLYRSHWSDYITKLRQIQLCSSIIRLMPRPSKEDTLILEAALIGFQQMRGELEQKIASIRGQITGVTTAPAASSPAGEGSAPKRTMSASARRRIAAAQKKRWAALKAAHPPAAKAAKPKRKLSAAGRARIIAATRKRWAAFHKAQKPGTAGAA